MSTKMLFKRANYLSVVTEQCEHVVKYDDSLDYKHQNQKESDG